MRNQMRLRQSLAVRNAWAGKKQKDDVRDQEVQVHPRVVRGSGSVKQQLGQRDDDQDDKRRQKRRQDHTLVFALIGAEIKGQRPEEKQHSGPSFEDGFGPVFDRPVGKNREDGERAEADANEFHGLVLAEDSGTTATSSTQEVP